MRGRTKLSLLITTVLLVAVGIGLYFLWPDKEYWLGKVGWGPKIVAKVGDKVVTEKEWSDQYNAQIKLNSIDASPTQADISLFKKDNLEKMINRRFYDYISTEKQINVTDEQVQKLIDQAIDSIDKVDNIDQMKAYAEQIYGWDFETYRRTKYYQALESLITETQIKWVEGYYLAFRYDWVYGESDPRSKIWTEEVRKKWASDSIKKYTEGLEDPKQMEKIFEDVKKDPQYVFSNTVLHGKYDKLRAPSLAAFGQSVRDNIYNTKPGKVLPVSEFRRDIKSSDPEFADTILPYYGFYYRVANLAEGGGEYSSIGDLIEAFKNKHKVKMYVHV